MGAPGCCVNSNQVIDYIFCFFQGYLSKRRWFACFRSLGKGRRILSRLDFFAVRGHGVLQPPAQDANEYENSANDDKRGGAVDDEEANYGD